MTTTISCVIPCYGSRDTIINVVDNLRCEFYSRKDYQYELVLVNDASPDNLLDILIELTKTDSNIKVVDLSRNFGQHSAIMAGINNAIGDIFVFLDDDGQTPPSQIWKLIDALDDSCDVVYGRYEIKHHSLLRNFGSSINDFMARLLIDKPKKLSLSSYFACKSFVVSELTMYKGCFPYLAGLVLRTTKRIKNVTVEHKVREHGVSGYNFRKLLTLWLNGFTAFSIKPLRIATVMGMIVASFGFFYGLFIIGRSLFFVSEAPMGWNSLMAVLLLIGGMIMIMLGMIGEYIGRIYMNINNSPLFVIRERYGFDGVKVGSKS